MLKSLLTVFFASLAVVTASPGQETFALKVSNIDIVPNSVRDLKDFSRDRPMVEVASISKVPGEPLSLPAYRSYRLIVTVEPTGKTKPTSSFIVRAESVRDGKAKRLGETKVMLGARRTVLACYDVFPGEGEAGDCVIRMSIVSDVEGAKGESLEFKASIVK